MVWVVADERQVVAALACPLVEASVDILCASDLEEHGFLLGGAFVVFVVGGGGERVEHFGGSSLAAAWI